jgi:hypothetical protein
MKAPPGPVVPFADATAFVNDNAARIGGTLRAVGPVDGRARLEGGRRVSFSLDGVLFFLGPRYVRFDLKRFGDRKLLIGSNETHYWYLDVENEVRRCGRHDGTRQADELAVPIPPDQIIDALGLLKIPTESEARLLHRVNEDFQQVLWIGEENEGAMLRKEYWLDRRPPRLVRRVVFRDETGTVQMESHLDDYRELSSGGPQVPHEITAQWPGTGGELRFRVSKWTVHTDIDGNGVQFASPPECGAK